MRSITPKKWGILTLGTILSLIFLIAAAVIFIDPFQFYRKATFFIPPISGAWQSYTNPGIARTYDYDSVVIGTSMTENFCPTQMNELLGGSFVKLPTNGGTPRNHAINMDLAFKSHEVKRVFYCLDSMMLTFFPKELKEALPDYLYDDNPLNDISYWFNLDVVTNYLPMALSTLGQTDDQLDSMYSWRGQYIAGAGPVFESFDFIPGELDQNLTLLDIENYPKDASPAQNVRQHIESYVQAHPETEFIFFTPPYSIAYWVNCYQEGYIAGELRDKEYAISRLLTYDNVKIYDFTAQMEWITDTDNYIDIMHYDGFINDEIVERISRGENRILSVADAQVNDQRIIDTVQYIMRQPSWPDEIPY